jgi:YNFM family putative membrane transporter
MAYLSEEIPPDRLGRAMGLYVGGTAFGGMIGRVAIGALTHLSSWRTALATMALVDLLVAVGFLLLLPRSRNFVRRSALRLHLDAWGGHLRQRELPFLFAIGFFVMGAFVTIYNYAGFRLLAPPYRLNQTQIGLIFLSYVFGMFASSAAGALADRLGRTSVVVAGSLVTMSGLALTLLHPLTSVIAGIVVNHGWVLHGAFGRERVGRPPRESQQKSRSLALSAFVLFRIEHSRVSRRMVLA